MFLMCVGMWFLIFWILIANTKWKTNTNACAKFFANQFTNKNHFKARIQSHYYYRKTMEQMNGIYLSGNSTGMFNTIAQISSDFGRRKSGNKADMWGGLTGNWNHDSWYHWW